MHWGFENIGCKSILPTDEDEVVFNQTHQEQYKRIEKLINKYKIDAIFCEGYSNMNTYGILELCKKYNVQYHHWAIEDPVTPHIGECFAKLGIDFIWTTCEEFIPKYRKMGCKSDLLLFGCNPTIDCKTPEDRFKAGISIVGSNYDNRWKKVKEFILPLLEDEFDPAIYGIWWTSKTQPFRLQDYGKEKYYWLIKEGYDALPYEWLPIVVNSSKIMIGLNCDDSSITQTSCRPYETLSCAYNSVYLAWYTQAQNNIFGDYIYQAKTPDEMVRMAREIMNMSDEQRAEIATRAREFVRKNHSYTIRAKKVVDCIKSL